MEVSHTELDAKTSRLRRIGKAIGTGLVEMLHITGPPISAYQTQSENDFAAAGSDMREAMADIDTAIQ